MADYAEENCQCNPCECDAPVVTCQCNPCLCDSPDGNCLCDPCYCDTPKGSEEGSECGEGDEGKPTYTLNEFSRAKEFFKINSTNSGLNVYDHLSEVLRKMLDSRNPPNIVDFMEEISLNTKRYRFGISGHEVVRDSHYISPPVLQDAQLLVNSWKKHALWSVKRAEQDGEDRASFGGFPNLLRLLYYLEQVNIGLPREEMFRVALALRELFMNSWVERARFWGKVFGIYKNYYVVELEFKADAPDDVWQPPPPTPPPRTVPPTAGQLADDLPGAGATFQRAGGAVTDPEILVPYQETSGLPPGATSILPKPLPEEEGEFYGEGGIQNLVYEDPESAAEVARWEQYQNELMTGFPNPPPPPPTFTVPPEEPGMGLNRRAFYVCNELGDDWVRLPDTTPEQINGTRTLRWQLSGTLSSKVKTFPEFPGLEGNFLRALLARATAGAQVSPRGYFHTTDYGEEEEEEMGEEEEEEIEDGDDTVFPLRKFRPPSMGALLNPEVRAWVHHAAGILRQGRLSWIKPIKSGGGDEEDEGEGMEEEEEEGEEEEGTNLFMSLAADKTLDGTAPWSTRASSTVFTEFQVASVRSNLWPGANAICTSKGKVENIYFGDGLKFSPSTYAPPVPEEPQSEYIIGPELSEITDPTVKEEQDWLAKLQLAEIADVEAKFVDNEEEVEEEESDED